MGQTDISTEARLAALARSDKWYLSAGEGMLWAPPFPVWLHTPGFWDEAHVYYHPFAPLFSIALIEKNGREIPLVQRSQNWAPNRLTTQWGLPDGTELREEKYVGSGGRFVSRWHMSEALRQREGVHLVAFSVQPGDTVNAAMAVGQGVRWRRTLSDRREVEMAVEATLKIAGEAVQVSAVRSEGSAVQPIWRFTPFAERWGAYGGLDGEVSLAGISTRGLVYVAAAIPVQQASNDSIEITLHIQPTDPALQIPSSPQVAGAQADPQKPWIQFFDQFPRFSCDDVYLSRYFNYRIYGLFLNRLSGGIGHWRHPAIAEGIGYFHVPITYSAQCHMMEMRWCRDPEVAHGTLRNFLAHQKPDGGFHGRLYPNHLTGTDFYHANWGDAVWAVERCHPDRTFLQEAYTGLARYAHWLDTTRDREQCGLYDVVDQYETGQEQMSRYQAVDPDADRYGWENRIRLKGIDVTVYVYQLKQALAQMAERLHQPEEATAWHAAANRIGTALLNHMWDEEIGLFSDVDPRTMTRTGVKAAVCFYPLLTDLLTEDHICHLLKHLEDEQGFATPFPVPSSSVDDPLFDAYAWWKGKRHVCPWNGRVWPMTNSHMLEGLLRQWQTGRRTVGPVAGRLLQTFVRMMFHHGDPDRPNCYEHYHPYTGAPALYRGIDDYQHSWVLDLLIRGAAGLEPRADHLLVDPLPMPFDTLSLNQVHIAGHTVAVHRTGATLEIVVDGTRHQTTVGTPLRIPW